MNALVLAAGLGTRLLPFTQTVPKPLIPFMSVPLSCYPLALLDQIKIRNLVINLHYLPDQVQTFYRDLRWPCKKLYFSDETEKILGSGGAIRKAEEFLEGRGNFIYTNADEIILPHSYWSPKNLVAFHESHGGIASLLCIEHPEVGGKFGGAWVDPSTNEIQKFSKTKIPNLKGFHFVGVILFSDQIFKYFTKSEGEEENILYDTLTNALSQGEKAYALPIEAEWFETGNPQDFISSTKHCLEGLKETPRPFWADYLAQVIRLHSVDRFHIENEALLLADLKKTIQAAKSE